MMVPRAAFTLAAVLLCASSIHASASGAAQSRVLWQGPALAGNAVVWGEESGGSGSLHRWTRERGDQVLYDSDSLALARPLAVSRTFLAFERSYPACKPQPTFVCPQVQDVLVGPTHGPFRTLIRPRKCSM